MLDTGAYTLLAGYADHEDLFLTIVAVASVVAELGFPIWLLRRGWGVVVTTSGRRSTCRRSARAGRFTRADAAWVRTAAPGRRDGGHVDTQTTIYRIETRCEAGARVLRPFVDAFAAQPPTGEGGGRAGEGRAFTIATVTLRR